MFIELILLIFMPLIFGLFYLVFNKAKYKSLSYVLLAMGSILSILVAYQGPQEFVLQGNLYKNAELAILTMEAILIIVLLSFSLKHKKIFTFSLVMIQSFILLYSVFFSKGSHEAILKVDRLSIIMLLLINILGTLIVVFATGYIEEYEHHRHMKSKQKSFYFIICLFLSAMNGLVISDSLGWVFFFWEITTVASFLLISFNGDTEAYKSAFRALSINLFGGICFGIGMILFSEMLGITELSQLVSSGKLAGVGMIPVFLLCIAGFTKAAQFPFQSWLLGAMVAPTPVSALLHSSTMVKAGVYLIIKLSPSYASTSFGTGIALYGAFVFLICSAIAVSQSNAKRVLAYSTIANLGLIISSAGIGSSISISAAIILIIFHAVSKALLFLCTGQIEHTIDSRDIENMSGLINKAPVLAAITALGIVSMILPPFGVLVTKWLALEASAVHPGVVILLVLGSALTTLYYIKWIGSLLSNPTVAHNPYEKKEANIYGPLVILGCATVLISMLLTPIYNGLVSPEVNALLGAQNEIIASKGELIYEAGRFNDFIVFIFAAILFVIFVILKKSTPKVKSIYMCGENYTSKGVAFFRAADGTGVESNVSNLYMNRIFNEGYLTVFGYIVTFILFIIIAVGGIL
jgi:ech hydrogenase subunit A